MNNITSRPYQTANPQQCCERCVFGTGKHADFCESPTVQMLREMNATLVAGNRQLHEDYDREMEAQ